MSKVLKQSMSKLEKHSIGWMLSGRVESLSIYRPLEQPFAYASNVTVENDDQSCSADSWIKSFKVKLNQKCCKGRFLINTSDKDWSCLGFVVGSFVELLNASLVACSKRNGIVLLASFSLFASDHQTNLDVGIPHQPFSMNLRNSSMFLPGLRCSTLNSR
eukprot:5842626-Amphidinium_carterae.1